MIFFMLLKMSATSKVLPEEDSLLEIVIDVFYYLHCKNLMDILIRKTNTLLSEINSLKKFESNILRCQMKKFSILLASTLYMSQSKIITKVIFYLTEEFPLIEFLLWVLIGRKRRL